MYAALIVICAEIDKSASCLLFVLHLPFLHICCGSGGMGLEVSHTSSLRPRYTSSLRPHTLFMVFSVECIVELSAACVC